MATTPTTKSQVQAYRFVLRRMQSALVRKDAVMLHDPMRTHQRSTVIGVIAAAAGIVGFLVFGVLKPAPSLPDSGIVISQQSGAVYVVAGTNPKKLIPATNMASAKLLLMALGGGSASNSTPSVVDENAMQGTPRDRLTGIVGAPDLLPAKNQMISPNWAVCDETNPAANQQSQVKPTTTVLGGVSALGPELGANQALLVSATNEAWLVYRAPKGAGVPSGSKIVRAKLPNDNMIGTAVRQAYGIDPAHLTFRQVSAGLLNAIPAVQPLAKPNFAGAGQATSYLPNVKVGQVLQVNNAGTVDFYVALHDGIKPIPQSVAKFILSLSQSSITTVQPGQIPSLPNSTLSLAIDDYPASPTLDVLDASKSPVACFSWSLKGNQEQTTVTIPPNVPLPNGMSAVQVSNGDPNMADLAYLPPGHAAVVRRATSEADFIRGPIVLVSDRGVTFGIPDDPNHSVANALGLGSQFDPAPESIIKLLPAGPGLNPDEAQRQYDAVTVKDTVGTPPTKKSTPQPGG